MSAPVTGFEPGTLWSHGEGNSKKICYMAATTEDNKHKCPECGILETYRLTMNSGIQYYTNSIQHGEGCSLSIYNFCQQNPRVAIASGSGGRRKTKRRQSRRLRR